MKKIILSAIAIIAISIGAFAQSPEAFKYQAVVRDASQNVITNQAVGIQLTILQGSASGTIVYQETFAPTSNAYGLVNLEIGTGNVVSGTFSVLDWSVGPYFIETAMDASGGTTYVVMGTSQLLSVPYALYAKTAESVANDMINDADSVVGNEYNTSVVLNGTNLETTDGGGTIITNLSSLQDGVNDADADPTNELQNLSINGDTIFISGGDSIILPAPVNDNDWTINGANIYNANVGNVGIGVLSPNAVLDVKGSTAGSSSLSIRNGMDVSGAAQLAQIKFGFANSDSYPHFIVSRHNAGSPINNALEFYVSDGTANGAFPANAVHTMSLNGGNVGIGTLNPSAKLDVVGSVQIVDGTEGDGKVLTSDAAGNASWQGPIAFKAIVGANQNVGVNNVKVTHDVEQYDLGNNYNPTTGQFTAPSAGVYQFSTGMYRSEVTGQLYAIQVFKNGAFIHSLEFSSSANNNANVRNGSFSFYLNPGDIIEIYSFGAVNSTIVAHENNFFSGFKVR